MERLMFSPNILADKHFRPVVNAPTLLPYLFNTYFIIIRIVLVISNTLYSMTMHRI